MKTTLPKEIKTISEADKFIKELYKNGELFHFDDPVKEIFPNEPNKTHIHLDFLLDNLFDIRGYDPFETAVVISYVFPLEATGLKNAKELANDCKKHHEIVCLYKKDGKYWVSNFEPDNEEELIEEYLHGE